MMTTEKMISYISGPMIGIEEHNAPMFNQVANELREHGHEVINPIELDEPETEEPTWADYLRRDIFYVLQVDNLVVLPEWKRSRGALLEILLAKTLNVPVWDYETKDELKISHWEVCLLFAKAYKYWMQKENGSDGTNNSKGTPVQ